MFDWAEEAADGGEGRSRARHRKRRRRRGLAVLLALLLLILGLAAAGYSYYRWCEGASGPKTALTVTVPRGASGGDVVSLLHDHGVIRCGLVSRVVLRTRDDTFEAGTYHLTTNMPLGAALDSLDRGPVAPPSFRLTIPEGWRLTQIAARVQSVLHVPASSFLRLAQSARYSLPPYLPKGRPSVEGFLYPNTYQFARHGNTADSVIRRLLQGFRAAVRSLPWANVGNLHVSDYQLVTIASMIEREARVPRDRANIAAVIYNRLKRHMSLGIDATIQYIDPNPANGLTNSDLKIKSPYNTRLHPGLPPTPIASPGLPSLRAALDPAHVDYLYYVLCGADGHHAFARTNSQFLRLEARCLG